MGSLPRPEIPPGSQRDLVDALHELHHRAGWPSLRVLAREAGCSPTTVSAAFSSPRLPAWGLLEVLVAAMDGDVARFHRLWLAASTPQATSAPADLLIAGRRPELAIVRRHLEEGPGLLLVTGEAGMGKTHLVSTASTLVADSTFIATGSCLPLSTQVPLLPVTDVLRAAHDVDAGQWFKEALADCPPYVTGSLHRLLPELGEGATSPDTPDDEEARRRLFSAVEAVVTALASLRRFAVLLEDLHWADATTLDLIEHLLARRLRLPVLGTWRLDDPTTPDATTAWWQRVRRLPGCATLDLQPLRQDETATQIELLTAGAADPALVERIHRRSRGQPLFTEQLVGLDENDDLPRLLTDLLDRRLSGLRPQATAITRALGVADRPLPDTLLTDVVDLPPEQVAAGLHELADHRLLRASSGHDVELSHPLLAEAVRRRMLAFEQADEHRRLARALAGSPGSSPAEVAEHWRGAEDPAEEVVWRVAAAQAAAHRFALVQAAEQWQRALELWPDDAESVGTPPVRRHDAVLAALDALRYTDVPAAWELAEQTMSEMDGATGADAAALYRRASDLRRLLADSRGALELVERAVDIHRSGPPTVEYVRALQKQGWVFDASGRFDEAADTTIHALQICADLDAPTLYRSLLVQDAYRRFDTGDPAGALARLDEAADLEVDGPDPEGDIAVAVARTDILREAGVVGDRVAEAGRPGLEVAAAWGLETRDALILRSNTASALRLSGQVRRAAEIIDPVTVRDRPVHQEQTVHEERACLDVLRGRGAEALARLHLVDELPRPGLMNRIESAEKVAGAFLWCGRPQAALDRLVAVVRDAVALPASAALGADLALAARAASDVADVCGASRATRWDLRAQLEDLRAQALTDPFALAGGFVARPAHGATWAAELGRLVGTPPWTSGRRPPATGTGSAGRTTRRTADGAPRSWPWPTAGAPSLSGCSVARRTAPASTSPCRAPSPEPQPRRHRAERAQQPASTAVPLKQHEPEWHRLPPGKAHEGAGKPFACPSSWAPRPPGRLPSNGSGLSPSWRRTSNGDARCRNWPSSPTAPRPFSAPCQGPSSRAGGCRTQRKHPDQPDERLTRIAPDQPAVQIVMG